MNKSFDINNLNKHYKELESYNELIRNHQPMDKKTLLDLQQALQRIELRGFALIRAQAQSKPSTRRAEQYIKFRSKMARWEGTTTEVDIARKNKIISSATTTHEQNVEKVKSEEGCKNLLFTMAGIRLATGNESRLKEILKEKQEFMTDEGNGIKASTASQLFIQSKRFPLMREAVAKLRESYEQWDQLGLSGGDLTSLQKTIRVQQQNLQTLSEVLTSISRQSREKSAALSQLFLDPQLEPLLTKYDSGQKTMEEGDKGILQEKLQSRVDTLQSKKTDPLEVRKQRKQDRKNAPVTTTAIKQQAGLMQAKIKGKQWAAEQESLTAQGTSVNQVFMLQDPTSKEPVAFYKVGAGGEEAAGAMEMLMWDLAVIMGLEEQFVATGETTVRSGKELRGGSGKVHRLVDGQLVEERGAQPAKRGGIQPAQKGMLLKKWIQPSTTKKPHIDKEEVINATVATIAFGMFDAHSSNVFINEEGKIKFFDNTRSLPHSNGVINRGGYLVPSYRSSLLMLAESHEGLSSEELKQMRSLVWSYGKKIDQMKKYLQSPKGQAQLQKLPPGWLDPQKAIVAMRQRIDFMKHALESNQVHRLRDLVAHSSPDFRFSFALMLAGQENCRNFVRSYCEEDRLLTWCMGYFSNDMGFNSHNALIKNCTNAEIDVDKIKQWCDDPELSFEQIIRNLGEYLLRQHNKKSGRTASAWRQYELETIHDNNRNIESQLFQQAELDLKDKSRENAKNEVRTFTKEKLKTAGFSLNQIANDQQAIESLQSMVAPALSLVESTETNPSTFKLFWKDSTGEIEVALLDLDSRPGFVKSPSHKIPEISIEQFARVASQVCPWEVDYVEDIENFDVAVTSKEEAEKKLKDTSDAIIAWPSEELGVVQVSGNAHGKIIHIQYDTMTTPGSLHQIYPDGSLSSTAEAISTFKNS